MMPLSLIQVVPLLPPPEARQDPSVRHSAN